ncbi:MAG TPA: lasso peptide biosynthesis B2 protein [Candidatus Acidoferrum sp.]|nr:lasso peptide biosynthesis B2 protein [Candidatus Acidoferrum sp.]
MWEELRRFNSLERPARGLFLRASLLLPLISLSLRWRGFRGTQAFLRKFLSHPHNPGGDSPQERIPLTERMVRAASRRTWPRATCLEESLTLWWLLGRQGIGTELRVGVRKEGEKFEAHAWVEHNGAALNEPAAQHLHYAAFDAAFASLPPEPR